MGLGFVLILALSACQRYDGYTRYPCQEYANWKNPECQKPECQVTGTCTEDLVGEIVKGHQ